MNSVPCQASAERHGPLTPWVPAAEAFARRTYRTWGSQAAAATNAGMAHKAIDPRQPTWFATGKLAPAAIAALTANAVVYMLVIRPTRSGNSRLTKPGKSTLPIAIPAPKTAVPTNIAATGPAERSRMPAASTSIMPQTREGGRWLGVAPWEPSFVTPLFPSHLAAALLAWRVGIRRISLY